MLLLRSTKWNANLILLRDYAELVALCKVIAFDEVERKPNFVA